MPSHISIIDSTCGKFSKRRKRTIEIYFVITKFAHRARLPAVNYLTRAIIKRISREWACRAACIGAVTLDTISRRAEKQVALIIIVDVSISFISIRPCIVTSHRLVKFNTVPTFPLR